jgi:hypothetical protein
MKDRVVALSLERPPRVAEPLRRATAMFLSSSRTCLSAVPARVSAGELKSQDDEQRGTCKFQTVQLHRRLMWRLRRQLLMYAATLADSETHAAGVHIDGYCTGMRSAPCGQS